MSEVTSYSLFLKRERERERERDRIGGTSPSLRYSSNLTLAAKIPERVRKPPRRAPDPNEP